MSAGAGLVRTALPVLALAGVLLAGTLLAGCDRAERDMLRQPKLGRDAASPLFPDQRATRPPPDGSVVHAMGDAAAVSSGRRGQAEVLRRDTAMAQDALPARPSAALLQRGQQRYAIYCLPCHGAIGDGHGEVVRRGFPAPPTYHADRLRAAPDRHFFDVISNGYGVMYPFADRIAPDDRWAIVAYVRALQLSRHARIADLPDDLQARLAQADAGAAQTAPAGTWRPVVPPANGGPR